MDRRQEAHSLHVSGATEAGDGGGHGVGRVPDRNPATGGSLPSSDVPVVWVVASGGPKPPPLIAAEPRDADFGPHAVGPVKLVGHDLGEIVVVLFGGHHAGVHAEQAGLGHLLAEPLTGRRDYQLSLQPLRLAGELSLGRVLGPPPVPVLLGSRHRLHVGDGAATSGNCSRNAPVQVRPSRPDLRMRVVFVCSYLHTAAGGRPRAAAPSSDSRRSSLIHAQRRSRGCRVGASSLNPLDTRLASGCQPDAPPPQHVH